MSSEIVLPGAQSPDPLIDDLAEWLMSCALGENDVAPIFDGCCERLLAAGVPVRRAMVSFTTLHPLFGSVSLVWRRGEHVGLTEHLHGESFTTEQWRTSPLNYITEHQVDFLRRRLDGPEQLLDFPILPELAAQGHTDYLAYAVDFSNPGHRLATNNGILGSWSTDLRDGFSARHVSAMIRVQRRLAVALKAQIQLQVTRNILDTYLGHGPGEQVLNGDIKRGDGNEVHAIIWLSDLRNSTGLADTLPGDAFLKLLNEYFECTAGAVLNAGGEVLRFVGDSVLAIFPSHVTSSRDAARQALSAARDAEVRLAGVNAARTSAGLEPIDFGIGLHVGSVMFGNIGVPERLEFSVVGPAANEVSRLETLTKSLNRRVLVSGEFAALMALAWEPCGSHELRGVGAPVAVYAPPSV